jgi:hypothetical protein
MSAYLKDEEVSELETLYTGIVVARPWWCRDFVYVDMVYSHEGRPAAGEWADTNNPYEAHHWKTKAAAYKYLREHADLVELGYRVIDIHDYGWKVPSPCYAGKGGEA